jgi:hypothetical protein
MITKYILLIALQHYCKSGSSYTSVFTAVIPGVTVALNAATPPIYYGRVRSFDNSGNRGPWTSLIGSVATLIDSAEITELTATKIKAGTITSSIIALDGANSIIKSANYAAGSGGWAIKGDGTAEFGSASIRGGLKAESVFINADNRWRRNAGDTAANSEFKVGSADKYLYYDGNATLTFTGNLSAAGGTFSGALSAATGTFSGALSAATGTFSGDLSAAGGTFSGDLSAAGGTFSGDLSAAGGTFSGDLSAAGGTFSGDLSAAGGTFSGDLSAATGTFSGDISAAGGTIGGWSIAPTYLSAGSTVLYNNGAVTIGNFVLDNVGNLDAGQGEFNATIQSQATLRVVRSGYWSSSGGGGRGISLVGFRNSDNETVVGTIQFDNGFTDVSYNTSSDIRLKTIVDKPMNALEKILQITPRNYYWNEEADPITWERLAPDKKTIDYGFIAQELYEVFPQMVAVGGDDPKTEPWQIDYSRITPLLVKAIQELSAKVAVLESKMV